mmetsp:Transcript_14536/g.23121  ORF Transcript_14536/g.23121 Transcript_14536/m.23121 type:complete len:105 (-) Transcript_14536:298-612(-)
MTQFALRNTICSSGKQNVLVRTQQYICICLRVQPIAFEVPFNRNLQSQSHLSLFNVTLQKRPRKRDHQLRLETEDITLLMPQAVHTWRSSALSPSDSFCPTNIF